MLRFIAHTLFWIVTTALLVMLSPLLAVLSALSRSSACHVRSVDCQRRVPTYPGARDAHLRHRAHGAQDALSVSPAEDQDVRLGSSGRAGGP